MSALRELQRAALGALAADEARDRLAVAPQRRQRRRLVGLRAHAALELDQVVEGEEAAVARLLLAARQMAGDAEAFGRLAISGVTSNSSASAPWPKPTTRSCRRAWPSPASRPAAARYARRRCRRSWRAAVAHRLVVDAGGLGDRVGDARQRRRHAEMRHVLGRDLGLLEAALDHRRHDRHVAGIADPALLPLVVELVVDASGSDRRNRRARGLGQQRGDRLALADQDGRGAVSARHLDRACRLGAALLGGDHERLAVAARAPRSAPRCRHAGWRRHRWRRCSSGRSARRRRCRDAAGRGTERWWRRSAAPRSCARSRPVSASRAASTAMVTGSSSQLQKARSPLACALQRRIEPAVGIGDRRAEDGAGECRRQRRGYRKPSSTISVLDCGHRSVQMM